MSPTMTATTTTSTTTSTSTTLSLAAPLMHRVRFDSECVLIPDVPQPKRPRMLSKSYSLPLWRRARDRDDERNRSVAPLPLHLLVFPLLLLLLLASALLLLLPSPTPPGSSAVARAGDRHQVVPSYLPHGDSYCQQALLSGVVRSAPAYFLVCPSAAAPFYVLGRLTTATSATYDNAAAMPSKHAFFISDLVSSPRTIATPDFPPLSVAFFFSRFYIISFSIRLIGGAAP
ncbi:hypothetical protein B0H10DRAFT_660990 [Mycena sp. CBHHK59/15]|nr:hypothetical protein B0H10DRAFT_660990 [Mycena sp. CBHHK59/15]